MLPFCPTTSFRFFFHVRTPYGRQQMAVRSASTAARAGMSSFESMAATLSPQVRKTTKLAQKLGHLQPFVPVFPLDL